MSVCYLTPKARPVAVGAAGRGSVAVEPIAAGEVIAAFGGRCVTRDEFDLLPAGQQVRSIQIEEQLFLAGAPEPEPADFINHSCDPNCGMSGNTVWSPCATSSPARPSPTTTPRATAATTTSSSAPAARSTCRGKVTGYDWMLPELQLRYRGYFSPYLAARIASLVSVGAERRAFSLLSRTPRPRASAFAARGRAMVGPCDFSSSAPVVSGSSIVSIAARREVFEHIVVADVDPARAAACRRPGRLAARRRHPRRCRPTGSISSSWPRTSKADVIVNACDPRFNPPIFDAAFEAGCHYLDMAMHMSTPHPTDPYNNCGVKLGDAQFAVAEQWEERGLLALVAHGCRAGFSDVVARYASDHLFSRIDEIGVRDGADLVIDGFDFAPTFSIWTTIEECLNPPIIYERDRGWFTTAPFSEPETFVFPEGIGALGCVNVEHEEVLLMPRWLDVGRVTFKYGLGDEFIDVLRTLHKLGLDSTRPVTVRGRRRVAARPGGRHAAQPCRAGRPHARPHVRRLAGHRPRHRRASRAAPTCTKWSTTNGRCASTAIRPSCGRPPCTRWWRWRCWPPASGRARA